MRQVALIGLILFGSAVAAGVARAETEPTAEQVRFFETSIRPLLADKCHKCHGAEKQWGTLRLDSREAMLRGGDTGPAIVPGKPEESLLIRAINHADDSLKMPPKEKMTDKQIADVTRWVKLGARFPTATASKKKPTRDPNHWAFQPAAETAVPQTKNSAWSREPLDQFILVKLEAAQLAPTAVASKRTRIRRATFDLTGLPPTPEEIAEFLADERPDAFARLIDRLLASPAYGERWGRHWLDVARYADSNGLDENVAHGNAWRYRDYVVSSFNQDQPFEEFLVEQLAGDLLPATDDATRHRLLIATGFLALGPKVLAEVDETKMQMDIIDEQIDTVGRAILGLTLGCARCHDHKFDPIETADYYGLAGIFKSTRTMEHFKKVAKWHENPIPSPSALALKTAHDAQVAQRKETIQALVEKADAAVKASLPAGEAPPAKLETKYPDETKAELKRLRDELTQFEKSAPEMPTAMGVSEAAIVDVAIHIRGNPLKLGEVVPRRVPRVLAVASELKLDGQHSGRLEMARWLVDPNHPLTSRVLVNRVWRWHFGKGLVRTPDNFGLLGEPPTHPELLDWLARRTMQRGWSLKALHRQIVQSTTYQLDSHPDRTLTERDPENRLFGRTDVRRLEAEAVRDALIAVGGGLDQTLGGSLLTVKNRAYFFDHTSKDLTDYTSQRRSVYLPVVRNNVYDVFQLLDYPDAAVPNGDRPTTTIAPQALLMMNSDFVMKCSSDLAATVLTEPHSSDAQRIGSLYLRSYGREPTADEIASAQAFLRDVEQAVSSSEGTREQHRRRAWDSLCHTIVSSNEFIYVK
ncbi:MAG: PSD1 and planctomycete cytochrome C domain-containing protein [Planctomycetota bacterium]